MDDLSDQNKALVYTYIQEPITFGLWAPGTLYLGKERAVDPQTGLGLG